MSTQEERFAQIAAAIREKDGTTGPIKALDFAARIRAIPIGSGASDFAIPLVVTVDAGATVTAAHGETTVTATSGADGTAALILTAPGIWRVTAALGDKEKSTEIEVIDGYTAEFMLSSRLPVGYTELEYIHWEGNNNTFILLENINASTDRIVYEIYPESYGASSAGQSLLNCNTLLERYYYIAFFSTGSNTLQYSLNSISSMSSKTLPIYNVPIRFDIDFQAKKYTANDIALVGTQSNRDIGHGTKAIGNAKTGKSVRGKFYKFLHYRKGEIIHEYVPCINADGVCGIFDINTETFITNTHSAPTPVTPGPAV